MRNWRHFDFVLLGAVLILIILGLAFVRSATQGVPSLEETFSRQMAYAAAGALLLIVVASVDYRLLGTLQWTVYLAIIAMLGLVFIYGQISGGAKSWLGAGAVQPSELAKILLIVALGQYLALRQDQIRRLPVVDGQSRLVGMITLARIARDQGEEAAGEILKEVVTPPAPTSPPA